MHTFAHTHTSAVRCVERTEPGQQLCHDGGIRTCHVMAFKRISHDIKQHCRPYEQRTVGPVGARAGDISRSGASNISTKARIIYTMHPKVLLIHIVLHYGRPEEGVLAHKSTDTCKARLDSASTPFSDVHHTVRQRSGHQTAPTGRQSHTRRPNPILNPPRSAIMHACDLAPVTSCVPLKYPVQEHCKAARTVRYGSVQGLPAMQSAPASGGGCGNSYVSCARGGGTHPLGHHGVDVAAVMTGIADGCTAFFAAPERGVHVSADSFALAHTAGWPWISFHRPTRRALVPGTTHDAAFAQQTVASRSNNTLPTNEHVGVSGDGI